MVELSELSFENYKAFPRKETLEVRPLTILIGRNSSGKSAIARLPLLLSRSLSGSTQSPVDLDVDGVDFGGSFLDLIHNRSPHGAISLGGAFADENGGRISFNVRIQHYDEFMMQVVERMSLEIEKEGEISLVREPTANPVAEMAAYQLEKDGSTLGQIMVGFQGFMPHLEDGEPSDLRRAFDSFRIYLERIKPALSRIGYLGPFRAHPQRLYRFTGGLPQHVGTRGIDAPALLGADLLRKGGEVVKVVGEWYREHLGGWVLDVSREGAGFSLVLRNPAKPGVAVNLVDAGTGLSQVLALVVQRQFEALTGKGGGVEIVEQPELHLHPGAHGSLADLYIEAARQPGFRLIVETHSENFILRVRRRVAGGTLAPDRVALYSIDDAGSSGSRLQKIEILKTGEVSTWPKGVFAEDFEEVKAIRGEARRHQEANT